MKSEAVEQYTGLTNYFETKIQCGPNESDLLELFKSIDSDIQPFSYPSWIFVTLKIQLSCLCVSILFDFLKSNSTTLK